MKARLFVLFVLMSTGLRGAARGEICPGRIPDYVTEGRSAADGTDNAEHLPCFPDSEFKLLHVTRPSAGVDRVFDRVTVSASEFRQIVAGSGRVEFRMCRFPDAVDVTGPVSVVLSFRSCEFQGNVSIRYAEIANGVTFQDCLFDQDFTIGYSGIQKPFVAAGCVFTGRFEIEDVHLAGFRVSQSRFTREVAVKTVQSGVGLAFQTARFLRSVNLSDLELGSAVRFMECSWNHRCRIDLSDSTIPGGVLFNSCVFDGGAADGPAEFAAQIQVADSTLGSAFVLSRSGSRRFPSLRISRSVVPFLKFPDWSIAKIMVLPRGPLATAELEDIAEVLQLLRSSYEQEGRARNASSAREAYEAINSEMRGGPTRYLYKAKLLFGTGALWFAAICGVVVFILWVNARRWSLLPPAAEWWKVPQHVLFLSIHGLFYGPPKDLTVPGARWVLNAERAVGVVFFFLLGLAVNEWTRF